MAVITQSSRWIGVPIVANNDGRQQFGFRVPLTFRHLDQMDRTRVRERETLHHVAFRTLGDMRFWWALAEFNDIFDPTTELEPDLEVFIPPLDEILRVQTGTP